MLFWVAAAAMTVAACLAVLLPLTGRVGVTSRRSEHDLEVYRDQLRELERDAARGLIGAAEADEARAEIARRILRLDAQGDPQTGDAKPARGARLIASAAVLSVAAVSWGVYAGTGSPGLSDQPLAARLQQNPAGDPIETLVARAEAHLVSNPQDGRGWDVLAPIYLRMGRADDSVAAYRNAIRLEGESPRRLVGLGEALVGSAGGTVTAEAAQVFRTVLTLDGQNVGARYYLASADAQDGRLAQALETWRAILADLPADDRWRASLEATVAEAERRLAAASPGSPTAPGPGSADVEAASQMSDQERSQMIESMVAGLDARLRDNPGDTDGWGRLIRSYVVLDRTADAQAALARALDALGAQSKDGLQLAEFARSLGVKATE
jgi:cytochrome c-type biogenesis protein CcmH